MSDRVRIWPPDPRHGQRISMSLGGEEHVLSEAVATELNRELGAALAEVAQRDEAEPCDDCGTIDGHEDDCSIAPWVTGGDW